MGENFQTEFAGGGRIKSAGCAFAATLSKKYKKICLCVWEGANRGIHKKKDGGETSFVLFEKRAEKVFNSY